MPDAALTRPTPEPLALLRYLDVVLVIAALPLVALAGLPLLGYAVGAGAWIAQRAAGALLERQAQRTETCAARSASTSAARSGAPGSSAAPSSPSGSLGDREDGLTAAILVAVAFTVYFAISLILHAAGGSK